MHCFDLMVSIKMRQAELELLLLCMHEVGWQCILVIVKQLPL